MATATIQYVGESDASRARLRAIQQARFQIGELFIGQLPASMQVGYSVKIVQLERRSSRRRGVQVPYRVHPRPRSDEHPTAAGQRLASDPVPVRVLLEKRPPGLTPGKLLRDQSPYAASVRGCYPL